MDQLSAEGFGAFRVLLLHRFKQGAVQVEHRLAAW
jgi:hypothetical protein